MKWTVKLIAESGSGERAEEDVATIEREDLLSPTTVGLSIAEGKVILESLQKRMVAEQVQHHGASIESCLRCGLAFRTKGYYCSTLRSVYGNVPMRVRRLKRCPCSGQRGSWSTVFTNKYPITPELRYRKHHVNTGKYTAKAWAVPDQAGLRLDGSPTMR